MSPYGVRIRESRDSKDHPNSVPIILALDVTGSAGPIPKHLIVNGLPTIMADIIEAGIPDPQLLFMAIGDHFTDDAPLQVSQFESSDELLDNWLTKVWIEHGGGGNGGESYSLAHYFAAHHTATDSTEKRGKKGFLFTIGDEPTHKNYSASALKELMGTSEASNTDAYTLLVEAQKLYHVYHMHLVEGANGRSQSVINGWKELLGDHLILIDDHTKIPKLIAQIVNSISKETQSINPSINSTSPVIDSSNSIPDMF